MSVRSARIGGGVTNRQSAKSKVGNEELTVMWTPNPILIDLHHVYITG